MRNVGAARSRRDRILRRSKLRSRMTAKGQTVKTLAREIDENASHVYKVLSGTRAASSGAGHRIAVKLGLKDDPATLPARAPAIHH